jgi:hypothetical protein
LYAGKSAQIGGNLTLFEILKWIPIGAAEGRFSFTIIAFADATT